MNPDMSNGMSTERLMAHEVGSVATSAAGTGTRERRREARFDRRKEIELLPCASDDGVAESRWSFLRGEMIDCSVHGIGVVVDRQLQSGERFLVKVRVGRFPCVVLYTVRNCRPADGRGLWRIGAEFGGYVVAPGSTDRETIAEALMK